jgi:hypothetical protein
MEHNNNTRAKCGLLVLCGLPGSGKSTLARHIRDHVSQHGKCLVRSGEKCDVEIVTFDNWLHPELLAGGFTAEAWQRSRQAALGHLLGLLDKNMKHFINAKNESYALVIADDNHHLRR